MTRTRPLLAVLLALAPAASAMAEQTRPSGTLGASSGASAAQEPSEDSATSAPTAAAQRAPAAGASLPDRRSPPARRPAPPMAAPKPTVPSLTPPQAAATRPAAAKSSIAAPVVTGALLDRPVRPLAGVDTLHVEVLPPQGDADKCGLEATSLQPAAAYPIAASARLKVGRGTLTHMHIRISAVYVRRIEHCIMHADVRVSSLQQIELQHSRTAVPAYIPLWEKTDIRLVPRGLAPKVARDRLKQISEQLLIDWAGQN